MAKKSQLWLPYESVAQKKNLFVVPWISQCRHLQNTWPMWDLPISFVRRQGFWCQALPVVNTVPIIVQNTKIKYCDFLDVFSDDEEKSLHYPFVDPAWLALAAEAASSHLSLIHLEYNWLRLLASSPNVTVTLCWVYCNHYRQGTPTK